MDRMVSIYRTLLDLGTLYVCYDEAFGGGYKVVCDHNTIINGGPNEPPLIVCYVVALLSYLKGELGSFDITQ